MDRRHVGNDSTGHGMRADMRLQKLQTLLCRHTFFMHPGTKYRRTDSGHATAKPIVCTKCGKLHWCDLDYWLGEPPPDMDEVLEWER